LVGRREAPNGLRRDRSATDARPGRDSLRL